MLPHTMGALPDVRKRSENRVVSEVKKIMNRKNGSKWHNIRNYIIMYFIAHGHTKNAGFTHTLTIGMSITSNLGHKQRNQRNQNVKYFIVQLQ